MKVLEKAKKLFANKTARFVGLAALTIGNAAAIMATTIAWFALDNKQSTIQMVSGDLDVEIKTVTAYKYVYPYYKNSTEFIDYDSPGTIKKYILEDHTISFDDTEVDNITIASDDATVTLGTKFAGTSTTTPASASATNVCIPSSPSPYIPEFRYYLIGDSKFYGVDNSWTLANAYAFGLREDVTANKKAIIDNIVVSAGSTFTLVEALETGNTYVYNYFPLSSIAESNPAFRIIDSDEDGIDDALYCLRSGIFTFTYSPNTLEIELRTSDGGQKKDVSVIMNNSLDPTKISIDYAGSVDPAQYPTINSYVPEAIYNQNTTLILDVELNFKNPNPVLASLEIKRTDHTSNSIFNIDDRYADTTHNRVGYVDEDHVNPLRASDFYNYYAVFKKTPFANTAAIWSGLHRVGDASSQKFINGQTYDDKIDCVLNVSGTDSVTIAPSASDNIYHCYIGIDYDYEHCVYFLDKNRLGKTYLLDRDFGFHFYGTQISESGN